MAKIDTHTFVSNFNAGDQPEGVELFTDEKGHFYPLSHLFDGEVLGDALMLRATSPASMTITVSAGYVQIPSGDDFSYQCWLEEDVSLTVNAASATLNRKSAIVAYIDTGKVYEESQSNNPGLMVIEEIPGTETAGTPSNPSHSQIQSQIGSDNPYIILGYIDVPSQISTISQSRISDTRVQITLHQGIGLPSGTYASGFTLATAPSTAGSDTKIAVINAGAPIPAATSGKNLLVVEIAQ